MVKFGLLDAEAPSRIMGTVIEEIPVLLAVREIVEDANDIMDEEGAIERIVLRLGELDGNQSVGIAAILEVHSLICVIDKSLFKYGLNLTIFIHCQCYVLG
jgi:hypothetical protein